ncbi:MAG: KH domain-containing protein [Nitrososphaerota archaeon]
MAWHIMVYSRGLESAYTHPYAVHFFTDNKIPPDESFKRAEEILLKAFPEWGKDGDEYLAYVGYEELPLSLPPEAYVAATFNVGVKDVKAISTVPPALAKTLEDYRSRQLTLDIDGKSDYAKAKLIDTLNSLSDFKLYETHRGYHVRAKLPKPLSLAEILEIRRKLGDDPSRLRIDEIYMRSGFGDFLTNLLFNEKYWRDRPNGPLHHTVETEVSPNSITVEYDWNVSLSLPSTLITTTKGVVKMERNRIIFKGNFGYKEMQRTVASIEDNFWEYSVADRDKSDQSKDIKELVKDAYRKISPSLSIIVDKCQISFGNGVIIIHVPDELSHMVGRLIGKQGVNVKAVSDELGVRIKISQAGPPPEDVEMKRRLQDLLRRVA